MQRSVDNLQVGVPCASLRAQSERKNVAQVAFVHIGSHHIYLCAPLSGNKLHHRRLADLVHLCHDVLILGRCNLSAVAPEHLVAVVFLRVVRSGHHHAGGSALEADGVRKFGRRTNIVEKINVDAVGAHYVRGDPGELTAVIAAVEGHADAQVLSSGETAQHIVRKALRSHSYRVFVHAVGAGTHNAAKATGAEFKILVEGVLKSFGIGVAKMRDLCFCLLVEIAVQPSSSLDFIVFHIYCAIKCFCQNNLSSFQEWAACLPR